MRPPFNDRIPVRIQTVDIANDPMYDAGIAPHAATAAVCYGPTFPGVHHIVPGVGEAARAVLLDMLDPAIYKVEDARVLDGHTLHVHVWRYDNATPREERPWIVSIILDGDAIHDPPCYETWAEAVEFAVGTGPTDWAFEELADRAKAAR